MNFYAEKVEDVFADLHSSEKGLSEAEAVRRLEEQGKNKLAKGKKDSLVKRFFKQLADPMILILLAAAAVSGVLAVTRGESFADVIII
ncbi:MAG TPA: cation-transporting P-type ATPase, partial [Clostridiales bacterium]|nr:cation-transporting P-type ATPase [Clostridiales bacterium]